VLILPYRIVVILVIFESDGIRSHQPTTSAKWRGLSKPQRKEKKMKGEREGEDEGEREGEEAKVRACDYEMSLSAAL
jgi:hypothetical protein